MAQYDFVRFPFGLLPLGECERGTTPVGEGTLPYLKTFFIRLGGGVGECDG